MKRERHRFATINIRGYGSLGFARTTEKLSLGAQFGAVEFFLDLMEGVVADLLGLA